MKMLYRTKITYFTIYEDLFDHVAYEELISPQSTKDHIKELFIQKIDGRVGSELEDYDGFEIEIISEERYCEVD